MKKKRRIGILTGGGDVPGLNSVIKSVVYRGWENGCEVVGIRRGWEGLTHLDLESPKSRARYVVDLTRDNTRTIDRSGGTVLHWARGADGMGALLSGDVLYPGRLYIRDAAAYRSSVDRLVAFTANRPVAHVLGAHIENAATPFVDYPEGTAHQPDEHQLALGRAHLLELSDALASMAPGVERRRCRDFTIWPVEE